MTPPDPPESSHKSNKVSIAGGKFDEEPYVEFRYHPSSNELIDMDRGLSPNSEIMFLNMAFRWYPGEKELLVQRFDVLSIVSLPVSDRFYLNKCWKVRTGMEQVISPELEQELSGFFRTGGGLSAALGFLGQWYVMTDLNFNFAPEFAYSTYNTFGFTSGLITSFGYLWKSHIYGGTGWSFYGDTTHQWEAGMEQMFSPLTNFSLILKCGRFHVFNNDFDEISLRATLFF
jgi:hypothetical protein